MPAQIADMFIDEADDPRTDPPTAGGELDTLLGFLRWQRDTLPLKCSGLGAEALARRSLAPSELSLLGLVRHLADVERAWFRRVMAGEDAPPLTYSADHPDGDFLGAVADPEVVAEAWANWRAEVANADRFIAGAPSLDVVGKETSRGEMSLRWVLVHMIEEYARHLGHADLLREKIDGSLGQ